MTSEPHRLDCAEAVEHLYTYLDEELTPELEAAVRSHLAECAECFGHFELERAFLRFLEARSRAQRVPAPLRKRVFQQILLDENPGHG